MFKVFFNSQIKSNKDLILIIMDESLELRDDIAKLDKKYDGIISDAIKNKSLGKKGGYKNLYLKKGKETKEIFLYNIGNEIYIPNVFFLSDGKLGLRKKNGVVHMITKEEHERFYNEIK